MGKSNQAKKKSDKFYIDSRAALAEYIKYAPEQILAVEFKEERSVLEGEVSGLGIAVRIDKGLPRPVRATVRVSAVDETKIDLGADLILALDHISDPRNLGAIVRSAAFYGIRQIIVARDRQAPVTQAAVDTAQAGFALTEVVEVTNLSRCLRTLKDHGYWIVGADMDGESMDAIKGQYEKNVLVLGSEGRGMSQNVEKLCDRVLSIGRKNPAGGLESLNVSVAAGILIHGFCGV